jgi:hypothetical protein
MRRTLLSLWLGALLLRAAASAADTGDEAASNSPTSALRFRVGWPEGITYEMRKVSPELDEVGPLTYFTDVYLRGRVGLRLDVDAAVFAGVDRASEFDDDIAVRRARFYLLGDFRLGLPVSYKSRYRSKGTGSS